MLNHLHVQALEESDNSITAEDEGTDAIAESGFPTIPVYSYVEVIHIGQLIENNLENRKASVVQTFFNELKPLADEVIESDPMTEDMIYNAAFLIPWDNEPTFSQQVEVIDQKFGDRLRIRYNNFTAPYTFAQIS